MLSLLSKPKSDWLVLSMLSSSVDNVLIIAPWGLPPQWREVTYILELAEKRAIKFKCCTTLIPLLLSLEEEVKVNKVNNKVNVVIIVLDSLVDKYTRKEESVCYECYSELSEYVDEANKAGSYRELTLKLANFVKEFFKCLLKKYGLDLNVNLHVVIAPAIGSPGGNWVFKGDLQDFESTVLRELGGLCLDKPYSKIILDLSHGINFMPSLLMRLAPKLVSILLLAHRDLEKVRLEVYNSDPIPPRGVVEREIYINRVVYEDVKSILLIHTTDKFVDFSRIVRSNESLMSGFMQTKIDLVNEIDKVKEDLEYIYSSLYYPLPLALYYLTCEDRCKRIEGLGEVLNKLTDHVLVDLEKRIVMRVFRVDPDALYLYYLTRALCKRIERCDNEAPSVKYLKSSIITNVYKSVHEALSILVKRELSLVEGAILNKEEGLKKYNELFLRLKGNWKPLCEIKALLGKGKCRDKLQVDKRILIAHAGLQDDLVEVFIDEEPRLKYREDYKAEKILKESNLLVRIG